MSSSNSVIKNTIFQQPKSVERIGFLESVIIIFEFVLKRKFKRCLTISIRLMGNMKNVKLNWMMK